MKNKLSITDIVAKCLAVFWILDGFLQLQPNMFGQAFVTNILNSSLNGQPSFVHALVAFGIYLWNINPIMANILAVLIQVGIGLLLFFPRSDKRFRAGLYLSIVWGLIVWVFGEGLGLLFTGAASFYSGAPGSVLIYILLALFLLTDKPIQAQLFAKIGGWIMIAGSFLQLQSALWTSDGVQSSVMAASMESVHALAAFPTSVSGLLSANPGAGNLFLAGVLFIVGLVIVLKPNRASGAIGLGFLFLVWWLGQDFGMFSTLITGTSTDPNTAPILALFFVPLFLESQPEKYTYSFSAFFANKKDLAIRLLIFAVIILAAGLALELFPIVPPKPTSMGPGGMAPMGMTVKTFDLKPGDPVPTVDFQITQDPVAMGGWDIHILTTNFTWTPQYVNQAPVLDQGHAHIYIDGQLTVVYGPWYHLDTLSKGTHTIVVALAANDHSIFALNGAYIEKQETITQN